MPVSRRGSLLCLLLGLACIPRVGDRAGDGDTSNDGGGSGASAGGAGGKVAATGTDGGAAFRIEFSEPPFPSDADAASPGGEGADVLQACGFYTFAVERVPPELLLLLDRSGSMARLVDGGNPTVGLKSRWDLTSSALETILAQTEDDIAWGLKMYPTCKAAVISGSPGGCEFPAGSLVHDPCATQGFTAAPALAQHDLFAGLIRDNAPALDRGATPTATAIDEAVALLKQRTTPNPRYLLLATDGVPNCGLNAANQRDYSVEDTEGAIAAVQRSAAAGVPVFVLGVAISDNASSASAHEVLNRLAVAGGRARDGAVKYHPALDQTQLGNALAEIAAATISCTFALRAAPPEDAVAVVDVDGKRLPEDTVNGWSLASSRKAIIFNGLACAALKRGEFRQTAVTFGCPGEPPPPLAL